MTTFTKSTVESDALRDALLPKLISGEIRVKDAEKILQHKDAKAQ